MFIRSKAIPQWVWLSLISNGVLFFAVVVLTIRGNSNSISAVEESTTQQLEPASESVLSTNSGLGPRHRWTYQQWVDQLRREASAMASHSPQRLTVLAGDSLSLWFPSELLPSDRTWLNQGISGETSAGLLKRLKLFDITAPETIFVMIGINDLIRGMDDTTLLNNYREIIRDLVWVHPDAQIVVQSILPHSGKNANWEGRERLLKVSNERIRTLNEELKIIAQEENVYYLNLHPLFTDEEGNLKPELSTDGLHLNQQGYLVWSSGLKLFNQLFLE